MPAALAFEEPHRTVSLHLRPLASRILPNSLRTAAAELPTLSTARCSSSRVTPRCLVQYFTSNSLSIAMLLRRGGILVIESFAFAFCFYVWRLKYAAMMLVHLRRGGRAPYHMTVVSHLRASEIAQGQSGRCILPNSHPRPSAIATAVYVWVSMVLRNAFSNEPAVFRAAVFVASATLEALSRAWP